MPQDWRFWKPRARPPSSSRTASVAAALGMPSSEGVEAVERGCERLLTRWHLLHEVGMEAWPDGTRTSRYAFRHELYRQVLYERLSANRRRRFHQRIGERMEKAFAVDPCRIAAEMASHFDRSGDDARAASCLLLAARQARRRFAEREATAHLRAALRHLDELPPSADRDLHQLQTRLGLVLTSLLTERQKPEGEDRHLTRIRTLAAEIAEGPDLFRLQLTLAQIHFLRSLPDLAQPIVDRLVALAERGRPCQQMEAYVARGAMAMLHGRFVAAREDLQQALAIFGDGDPPAAASFPGYERKWRETGSRIHGHLGATLFLLGAADLALAHLQRATELCAGRIHPHYAAGRILSVAGIYCLRGDLELAQTLSDRGLALAREHQFAAQIAATSPQRLWLSIAGGDRRDARERIRAAWRDYLQARNSAPAPVGPLFIVDACRTVGAADEGLAIAEKVWNDTRASGLRWYDAELERLRGELILIGRKRGRRSDASACFQRSLRIARKQGTKSYELRSAMSVFRLCRERSGEADEARTRLESVYGNFDQGFDTRDLRVAAALLHDRREVAVTAKSLRRDR